MSYRSRSVRIQAKKTKRKLITTIIIIILLVYGGVKWIIPGFIGEVGVITGFFKTPKPVEKSVADSEILAPPVIFLPYEATNSSKINIGGYATSSKVKIYVNDQLKNITDVSIDGKFNIEDIKLELGENKIYGKSSDEKDHESLPSQTINLLYDNQTPSLKINEPEDGKEIQGDKKVTVSGKTDPDAQIYINDTRLIVNPVGEFSTSYNLNDGENTLIIKAQDKASNSKSETRKVIYKPDTSPSPSPN